MPAREVTLGADLEGIGAQFPRDPDARPVRPVDAGPHQRRLLCAAEPRPRGHLRSAQHRQLQPRRLLHDGRLRKLDPAHGVRRELLVGAAALAPRGRRARDRRRAHHDRASLPARPDLRAAPHLRPGADHPGPVPQCLRRFGHALCGTRRAAGRAQPRLHGPADLSRLGHRRLGRGLPRHVVRHREDEPRRHAARRDREPRHGLGLRHQRAAPRDADLRVRRRARGPGGRAGGADLFRQPQHGGRPHHRGLRRGGDRRHGLDPGFRHHRFRARPLRGLDQGGLPAGLLDRHLRDHDRRAAG